MSHVSGRTYRVTLRLKSSSTGTLTLRANGYDAASVHGSSTLACRCTDADPGASPRPIPNDHTHRLDRARTHRDWPGPARTAANVVDRRDLRPVRPGAGTLVA